MALPEPEPESRAATPAARVHSQRRPSRSLWRMLGPGLVTGAADDDPTAVGTCSIAGAQFGYGLLWLVPLMLPLMVAVQEMCGRIAAVTGKGLAAVLKEHYAPWILWSAVVLLLGANVINLWADLNVMAASAQMLFHLPFWLWLIIATVGTLVAQVLIPYRTYVRYLKWLALALLAYVVTVFLPGVDVHWSEVARRLVVPGWSSDPQYMLTAVSLLGGTISPYLFFWQAGETVEEQVASGAATAPGQRRRQVTDSEIHSLRADTTVGMVVSQVVSFFILVCGAAVLHARGITNLDTAQQAASALRPLGAAGYWLFSLAIIASGLLTVPTLAGSGAYALSEVTGWRYGLYRRYGRARAFYLSIVLVVLAGFGLNFLHAVSPLKALLYSAVVNGVIAPPLIVMLLLIGNNSRIVGERRNGPASNMLGWLTVVLMAAAAVFMLWGIATGKAS